MPSRTKMLIAILCVCLLYVGSYAILSRRAFAAADRVNFEGFYFLEPSDTSTWRALNYGLVYFYYPLIWVDCKIGTGRWPASEPLWGLSDVDKTDPNGVGQPRNAMWNAFSVRVVAGTSRPRVRCATLGYDVKRLRRNSQALHTAALYDGMQDHRASGGQFFILKLAAHPDMFICAGVVCRRCLALR